MACAIASVALTLSHTATAHIWRVNNDATRHPDFITIPAAVAAAAEGDTIHVEPSATAYGAFVLNKRLVILGSGYFLSGSGLQATTDSSVVNSMTVDSSATNANASGSLISGLSFLTTVNLIHNVHDVTLTRCLFAGLLSFVGFDRAAAGISISKCFLQSNLSGSGSTGLVTISIENNIFSAATGFGSGATILDANFTGLFRNNTLNSNAAAFTLNNFYIANNVFTFSAMAAINGGNNIIRNNSFAATAVAGITGGADGNQVNISMPALFTGSLMTGHGDTRFQTANGGSLRASGETISGITPDRGAYNTVATTDSYRSSGIPAIPTIYALTVPQSIPPTAVTMDISVSTRSNN